MLIDEPSVMTPEPILQIIGGGKPVIHLQKGCYEIGHFGSSHFLRDQGFVRVTSGVCDDLQNLLEKFPELEADPSRQFVVTLTRIDRSTQPDSGGWRWHKWGRYIGTQTPTTEYIADEPNIETVYCFRIHEKQRPDTVDVV